MVENLYFEFLKSYSGPFPDASLTALKNRSFAGTILEVFFSLTSFQKVAASLNMLFIYIIDR
jgi:hypothetical protein